MKQSHNITSIWKNWITYIPLENMKRKAIFCKILLKYNYDCIISLWCILGTSWVFCGFLLANGALGSSVLNYPQAVHQAGGIAPSIIMQMVNYNILLINFLKGFIMKITYYNFEEFFLLDSSKKQPNSICKKFEKCKSFFILG